MTFELGWGGESNIEKKITGKKGKYAYYLLPTHTNTKLHFRLFSPIMFTGKTEDF